MATQIPPKKNTEFVTYVGLRSQDNPSVFMENPVIAAGDVLVATDDGAPANIATLPEVDADFPSRVKVVVSAAEMNGDNTFVKFHDVVGAQWCDLGINIRTSTKQIDDLAVESGGNVAAIKTKTDNLPSDPADESLIEQAITDKTCRIFIKVGG